MVRQEHELSCGAACVRQLLLDGGIDVPEPRIRELAGFHPQLGGTIADGLRSALEALHVGHRYAAGAADVRDFEKLLRRAPLIVLLGKHWVILDRVERGLVHVRDPAGLAGDETGAGFEGVLARDVFDLQWTRGIHQVVFRTAP